MDRRLLVALTAFSAIALATPAQAQFQKSEGGVGLGVKAGIYMPTDKFIRDSFGNSILNYGIGSVAPNRPTSGTLTPELDFISADKNGNRLFIGSLTYGYEYHFSKDDQATTVPYARLFAGGAYFDYGVNTVNGRQSSKRIGLNYGAELGVVFAGKVRLAARYNAFNEQDGFNFSGFNLSATVNLIKL
jgi:hypothetical protein